LLIKDSSYLRFKEYCKYIIDKKIKIYFQLINFLAKYLLEILSVTRKLLKSKMLKAIAINFKEKKIYVFSQQKIIQI